MLTASQVATLRTDALSRAGIGGALESLWQQGASWTIAEWYNQPAQTGEFSAPLLVWKPSMTIDEINAVISWTQKPAGADTATQTLNCLIWQNMIWANHINMADTQVRQGISDIWGASSANDTAIRQAGRRAATRFEMVFAGSAVGGARVTPVCGQVCGMDDVTAAIALGG